MAKHILLSLEDCEECVNDTYLACWNVIPPKQPDKFSAFISRITRNLALNRFDYLTAEKRNPKAVCSLEELEQANPFDGAIPYQYLFSNKNTNYILTHVIDVQWDPSDPEKEQHYFMLMDSLSEIRFVLDNVL